MSNIVNPLRIHSVFMTHIGCNSGPYNLNFPQRQQLTEVDSILPLRVQRRFSVSLEAQHNAESVIAATVILETSRQNKDLMGMMENGGQSLEGIMMENGTMLLLLITEQIQPMFLFFMLMELIPVILLKQILQGA